MRSSAGAARRTSRSGSTAPSASTRSSLTSCVGSRHERPALLGRTAATRSNSSDGGWTPIRGHFGIEAFGVNSWTSTAPGESVVNDHERRTAGTRSSTSSSRAGPPSPSTASEIDAPAGTLVFVGEPGDPDGRPSRPSPTTTVLAIGAKPGEAYRPLGWEWSSEAFPFFGSGEPERAYELLSAANDRAPGCSQRPLQPRLRGSAAREERRGRRAPAARGGALPALRGVRARGHRLRLDPRRSGVRSP